MGNKYTRLPQGNVKFIDELNFHTQQTRILESALDLMRAAYNLPFTNENDARAILDVLFNANKIIDTFIENYKNSNLSEPLDMIKHHNSILFNIRVYDLVLMVHIRLACKRDINYHSNYTDDVKCAAHTILREELSN